MPIASFKMGRQAFATAGSSSLGIITGALLDAIIIALFGLHQDTDAYFIAITLPIIIIGILSMQATRVIQPIFIKKFQVEGETEGWRYINVVATTGSAILAVLCGVGALLSPLLIRAQSGGSSHEGVLLATRLSVFFFFILPLYFPIVVLRVTLNSFGIFALPGAMKLFENSFKIAFVLLLGHVLGVQALVLGMLAGALFQIATFYLALRRKGFRFRPILRLRDPDVGRAYSLMVFPLVGQLFGAGVDLVNNNIGSMLGTGNVTALRLATRIIDSFANLLPGSIIIAAMPGIASSVSARDPEATKRHVRQGLFLLLMVTMPMAVWMGLESRPLISLLYERARFSFADTVLVSNVLMLMIPYVLFSRLISLVELPFFAAQDTRTPLLGGFTQIVVYLLFTLPLVSFWGIYALPLGRSVSYLSGSCFLAYLLRRRMGNLGFATLRGSAAKVFLGSLIMAVFILLGDRLAAALPVRGIIAKIVALGLPLSLGSAALVAALFGLGILTPGMLDRLPPFVRGPCSVLLAMLTGAKERFVRRTRSGEYRLPGFLKMRLGNFALAQAQRAPRSIREKFLRRAPSYQVFNEAALGEQQGLSINKWNAMRMPSSLEGKSVLDIGCADGFFCQMCAKSRARRVLGIDSTLGRLMRARLKAVEEQLNIDYRMDVFPSPRVRNKFDYVLCLSVLHHSLSQKNVWKVLADEKFADDLAALRLNLKALRAVTSEQGRCLIEMPYEYSDPSERQEVDFQRFNSELTRAGFAYAECLGTWEHNPRHKEKKDRVIYLANAQTPEEVTAFPAVAGSGEGKRLATRTLCTWSNGRRAVVRLVELLDGEKQIVKAYKPGFFWWMLREFLNTRYLGSRLPIVPKLIRFRPLQRELVVSYVPGQRVLEWVLERFGETNLRLEEFLNFEEMGSDSRVLEAFHRLRQSTSQESTNLKQEVKRSYAMLHALKWQHGTCDPRNMIYDGHRVHIIDFDHARPSLSPGRYDHPALRRWFGIVWPASGNGLGGEDKGDGPTAGVNGCAARSSLRAGELVGQAEGESKP